LSYFLINNNNSYMLPVLYDFLLHLLQRLNMLQYISRLSFKSYCYCKLSQVISRVSQKYKKHNDEDFIKYLSNIRSLFLSNYISS